LIKNSVCQKHKAQHHKNNRLFRRNNRLFIPVHKYKLNLKSLRIERLNTGLYWFTLNQDLHPVFPEITRESTKQSTLDYLQHHQSDLDPLKTHTSFGSTQTQLRMLILTTSRTHSTSQLHTQSFFKVHKDYTCYRKDLKSIQDENPISHSLDQNNLKAISNSSKAKTS